MSVEQYIYENKKRGKTLHMTLIDPEKQSAEDAARIAFRCKNAGTDAIMVGGSTGITTKNIDMTANAVKKATNLPVIYFPAGPHALSAKCDAMYYMSILNSRDLNMVIRAQAFAAPYVKKIGIETIPMGYVIVEPGMKVGRITKADLLKRNDISAAIEYALGAQYLGMRLIYFETGSGSDKEVPQEMIKAVKEQIDIPLVVGGGIRTPEIARAVRMAGADVIVTGTFIELCSDENEIKKVIAAAKGC
ncbi:MAG: geranylgeranylglyceryl/heptaprenylglyceryl phosphate synthase [archaeon]|nr:geranylgeranylglyceryl/heptaprenylglyceryl phosphate synthase [archaeon]